MKTLTELINENMNLTELKSDKKSGIDWSNSFSDLLACGKEYAKEYTKVLKDNIKENISKYYQANPHKRSCMRAGHVYVKCSFAPLKKSKACDDLYNLMDSIGMSNWWYKNFNNFTLAEFTYIANSSTKSMENIKWEEKRYIPVPQKFEEYGNGYNSLSGDIITDYKRKVLACVKNTLVTVSTDDHNSIYIVLTPIFDDSKIKDIIKEIEDNPDLMKLVDINKAHAKGMSDYYKSKRSGDYSGD